MLTPTLPYGAVPLTVLAVGLIAAAAVIEATLTLEIAERLTGQELPRPLRAVAYAGPELGWSRHRRLEEGDPEQA